MVRTQSGQVFDHISSFGASLRKLIREINVGLVALHRVQFDEPWKVARRPMYGEW